MGAWPGRPDGRAGHTEPHVRTGGRATAAVQPEASAQGTAGVEPQKLDKSVLPLEVK